LFGVQFVESLLGHAVNVEVVADLGVSVNALAVSLSDALRKDTWVLGVEEQIDAE